MAEKCGEEGAGAGREGLRRIATDGVGILVAGGKEGLVGLVSPFRRGHSMPIIHFQAFTMRCNPKSQGRRCLREGVERLHWRLSPLQGKCDTYSCKGMDMFFVDLAQVFSLA